MSIAQQQPIGVFDSGIGGLSVANAISGRLPQESLLYFADTAHVPYGPRSIEEIRTFSFQATRFLLARGCKLIVVACNTATAAALPQLRAQWPSIPFVGMEPAVKPAAQATRSGKVGVLATASTIRSERYADLMARYAAGVSVYENPCIGLVPLIESSQLNTEENAASGEGYPRSHDCTRGGHPGLGLHALSFHTTTFGGFVGRNGTGDRPCPGRSPSSGAALERTSLAQEFRRGRNSSSSLRFRPFAEHRLIHTTTL